MRLPRRTAHFSGWVHEVKFDGWRLQVHKHGQDVWLYSGNGRALTHRWIKVKARGWREANADRREHLQRRSS